MQWGPEQLCLRKPRSAEPLLSLVSLVPVDILRCGKNGRRIVGRLLHPHKRRGDLADDIRSLFEIEFFDQAMIGECQSIDRIGEAEDRQADKLAIDLIQLMIKRKRAITLAGFALVRCLKLAIAAGQRRRVNHIPPRFRRPSLAL